ncbi:hypothetical protein BDW71DRAFT_174971 [Aspergillus fruticulosus]
MAHFDPHIRGSLYAAARELTRQSDTATGNRSMAGSRQIILFTTYRLICTLSADYFGNITSSLQLLLCSYIADPSLRVSARIGMCILCTEPNCATDSYGASCKTQSSVIFKPWTC